MQADLTRLASALLFGSEAPDNVSDAAASQLPSMLRRNRVPVAALRPAAMLERLAANEAIAHYLAEETARYERAKDAYSEVAEAWSDIGIEGVLIKSAGDFPNTSSNVDVLVQKVQADAACETLGRLGYVELPGDREPHKLLFRRFRNPHFGFPIHLHTAVGWVNRFLTDTDVAHARRSNEKLPLLSYPSAEHVVIITTAHWLYEDKELTFRDLVALGRAVEDGVSWDSVRQQSDLAGWRRGLELALAIYRLAGERLGVPLFAGLPPPDSRRLGTLKAVTRRLERREWQLPFRLSKTLCKGLHLAKTAEDTQLNVTAKLAEASTVLASTMRVRLRLAARRRFALVSVSGPDGSGKTSLAEGLCGVFHQDLGLPGTYQWGRLASSDSLEAMKTATRPLLPNRVPRGISGEHAGLPVKSLLKEHSALREAWSYVLLSDFLVRTWARRLRLRASGGIHVFDRYALDAAVDLKVIYGFQRCRLATALAPTADVQILLTAVHDEENVSPATVSGATYGAVAPAVYLAHGSVPDLTFDGTESVNSQVERAARNILEAYFSDASPVLGFGAEGDREA